MKEEYPYWLALTHLPKMRNLRKNELVVKFHKEQQVSIVDFFHCTKTEWKEIYKLDMEEIQQLDDAKNQLSEYSFIVEDLMEQGYEIIPIISSDYSQIMKKNMKLQYSPPLIYTKGDKNLMKIASVAIVGSRKASLKALQFTDNIAKAETNKNKVIVSGFAKGVDRKALDSTMQYKGHSIIVLPQGITTFTSGFTEYYKKIVSGNILVLSTFPPRASWRVQFAMARNKYIYGLSKEIYVAESDEKGGTWSGVNEGLRRERKIFVRIPSKSENNANDLLIQAGATPVDKQGNKIKKYSVPLSEVDVKIFDILEHNDLSSKEIIERLNMDWKSRKMTMHLKKNKDIHLVSGKSPLRFTLKKQKKVQQSLSI